MLLGDKKLIVQRASVGAKSGPLAATNVTAAALMAPVQLQVIHYIFYSFIKLLNSIFFYLIKIRFQVYKLIHLDLNHQKYFV